MATDALQISAIDVLYGDSHVLHEVSFSLREGTVLGLLGSNGAGKTTSINAIIGFLPPRAGAILLHGERIEHRTPEAIARLGVGLVPQGRRIFPSLSVRDNLLVAANARGQSPRWQLHSVYALFPRLRERERQLGGLLSGGEQQMLAIGRALMGNPRVLLLDEPSEGLAPLIVNELGHTIARLKAEGLSIVLVEQNLTLALGLADDVVILNTGRVVHQGPAAALHSSDAVITQHLGVV